MPKNENEWKFIEININQFTQIINILDATIPGNFIEKMFEYFDFKLNFNKIKVKTVIDMLKQKP